MWAYFFHLVGSRVKEDTIVLLNFKKVKTFNIIINLQIKCIRQTCQNFRVRIKQDNN